MIFDKLLLTRISEFVRSWTGVLDLRRFTGDSEESFGNLKSKNILIKYIGWFRLGFEGVLGIGVVENDECGLDSMGWC